MSSQEVIEILSKYYDLSKPVFPKGTYVPENMPLDMKYELSKLPPKIRKAVTQIDQFLVRNPLKTVAFFLGGITMIVSYSIFLVPQKVDSDLKVFYVSEYSNLYSSINIRELNGEVLTCNLNNPASCGRKINIGAYKNVKLLAGSNFFRINQLDSSDYVILELRNDKKSDLVLGQAVNMRLSITSESGNSFIIDFNFLIEK